MPAKQQPFPPRCPGCGSTAIDIEPDAFMEGSHMLRIERIGGRLRVTAPDLSINAMNLNETAICRTCSYERSLDAFTTDRDYYREADGLDGSR